MLVDNGIVVICCHTPHVAHNKCIRLRLREAVSQFIQDGAPEFRHSWNDVQLVRHFLNVAKKRFTLPNLKSELVIKSCKLKCIVFKASVSIRIRLPDRSVLVYTDRHELWLSSNYTLTLSKVKHRRQRKSNIISLPDIM